ncbi:MAG: aspartyl protease family protein [Treponema sp.]|jgi:clan AA aspartic protease|nr:aspartyl protease family protein [Treponema sp.]
MGTVYADLILKNAGDVNNIWRGYTTEQDVRQVVVQAVVDTGAGTLVFGEDICEKLGLSIRGLRRITLAGGEHAVVRVTEPVEIHWKDRFCTFNGMVLPGEHEVLLGAIPLEDMDLIVDPNRQQLIGAHGDEPIGRIKRAG